MAADGAVQAAFPAWIAPQLASAIDRPPEGPEWVHEAKFDGYRILAFVNENKVRLLTRNRLEWTAKFSGIAESLSRLTVRQCVLDGEVCALDPNGVASFRRLQQSLKQPEQSALVYFVFDILYCDGWDLRNVELIRRKLLLKSFLRAAGKGPSFFAPHSVGSGRDIFALACKEQWEGIVSKAANSRYRSGRSRAWLKSKCIKREEFVIVGFTPYAAGPRQIGALLIGARDRGAKFRYCGKVGTGFSSRDRAELYRLLAGDATPLSAIKTAGAVKNAIWVKPRLAAEVSFTEWTDEGLLRHPSFVGLRLDKKARDVETPIFGGKK